MCSKRLLLFPLLLLLFANLGYSQSSNNLEEINEVWGKFYQAFDSLDYQLMAEIHSEDLVRISGGKKIVDYNTYINKYESSFKKARENGVSNKISLRFFERINTDDMASE